MVLKSHVRADKINVCFVGFYFLAVSVGLQRHIYGYSNYIFVHSHKYGLFHILNF